MRILMMSWPWVLLGSKLFIILPKSLSVNVMFDNDLSVKSLKSVGSTLLIIRKHQEVCGNIIEIIQMII